MDPRAISHFSSDMHEPQDRVQDRLGLGGATVPCPLPLPRRRCYLTRLCGEAFEVRFVEPSTIQEQDHCKFIAENARKCTDHENRSTFHEDIKKARQLIFPAFLSSTVYRLAEDQRMPSTCQSRDQTHRQTDKRLLTAEPAAYITAPNDESRSSTRYDVIRTCVR